jgi:hypothetical protein
MQILNWINDRWANENNDQPSNTCSNQPTSTPMVALGNMFSMAYTLSKSLFSFPLPQQNNLMAEQDFLSVLKTAEDMLNFYQSKIPPHQKTSFNQASLALHKLMEYSQRLTEALPTTYIKEVATLYTNFFDIVITPILSLLSRSDLLHIKTGGYLGLLFKLKALTLVEGIDQSSDMENYIQMIFSNLPYLKIQPQTADKVRESLIELPYSQNEDDISLLDMLCDFIVDDLNCA